MNEYIVFVQNHLLLVMGFVVVAGMLVWLEFNRFTRKYKQLDVNQAVLLMNREGSVVLDVREDGEVRAGKIQGAKHIPLGQLPTRLAELDKYKAEPLLVYCRSGNRSSMACAKLTKQGFSDVNNLAGGFVAWEAANLPVAKRCGRAVPIVRLYGTRFCPYCVRARFLLQRKGVAFEDLPVGGQGISWAELRSLSGRDTVPQIFVGAQHEHHIGGYDDLAALERAGQLDILLGLG